MTQPNILTVPFAESAASQTIQEIPISRDPSDPIQKASWSTGFPAATMQPLSTGGVPPMGQDFNGILKALSEHIVYQNKGGVYHWSADVVSAGGYDKGAVVQDDDGLRSYISLIDGNTEPLGGNNWLLISMPIATQAQAQALTSSDTLITPQRLGSAMNAHVLGMGQTWEEVTGRVFNTSYTNTTGRTICVSVRLTYTEGPSTHYLVVNGVRVYTATLSFLASDVSQFTLVAIVPPGAVYQIERQTGAVSNISLWMELR